MPKMVVTRSSRTVSAWPGFFAETSVASRWSTSCSRVVKFDGQIPPMRGLDLRGGVWVLGFRVQGSGLVCVMARRQRVEG